ncbi:hypothetical protein ABZ370_31795 [Streptomyces sp. NPDC005962]|uniref:hypothetical protein n=1 Tax=Streptomyces sp. NPDC005962 TaxID=3154466 RepID=UPI0033FB7067
MTVSFGVRRQAGAKFGHRSTGGPVTAFAQALHAQLYGLPTDPGPLPTALDALFQAAHTANTGEQKTAILRQLADQLRNAIEIIKDYEDTARWDRLPADIAQQLSQAHDQAQQIVRALDRVAPAFSNQPGTSPRPGHEQDLDRTPAAVSPPTPPARRHR